ncbi:MAG: hypothetical protein R3A80_03250 [Bdellovibrionota bacterium]
MSIGQDAHYVFPKEFGIPIDRDNRDLQGEIDVIRRHPLTRAIELIEVKETSFAHAFKVMRGGEEEAGTHQAQSQQMDKVEKQAERIGKLWSQLNQIAANSGQQLGQIHFLSIFPGSEARVEAQKRGALRAMGDENAGNVRAQSLFSGDNNNMLLLRSPPTAQGPQWIYNIVPFGQAP